MQWVVHREGESTGYRDSQRIAALPFVRAGEVFWWSHSPEKWPVCRQWQGPGQLSKNAWGFSAPMADCLSQCPCIYIR